MGVWSDILFAILLSAIILGLYRLIKGPTNADRMVALDILTTSTVVLIAFLAWYFQRIIYLDIALVYAALSFIAVIVLGRYLEGGV
jgi:multicomponent Na+:H+ antiporter subunit F